MKPHTIIRSGMAMRRAASLRNRSRRRSPSGFLSEMGMIEAFLASFPEDTEAFRETWRRKYAHHWERICPGGRSGDSVRKQLAEALA